MNKIPLLGIIVAIILIISVYYLHTQNKNPRQEIDASNNNIEAPEKQKPETVAEKRPEGWKEYVDEIYRFRVWYPEQFALSYPEINKSGRTSKTEINKFKNEQENTIDFSVNVLDDAPLRLLYIHIYNTDVGLKEYALSDAEKIIKGSPIISMQNKATESYITEIKSNGLIFYKFEIPGEDMIKYYIKRDNEIFVLNPENSEFSIYPGLKSALDQMIQSFKFIE